MTPTPAEAVLTLPTGYSTTHLIHGLAEAIRAVPCKGGRLDIVLYSTNNDVLIDLVLGRAKCGATVRLLTSYRKSDGKHSDKTLSPEVKRLVEGLREHNQTVLVEKGAMARKSDKGLEHEKLVAVDTGSSKYVLSDSGNWTFSTDKAFNDRMTVRDDCLYKATLQHMDLLASETPVESEAPARSCDGKRMLWWLPTTHTDPVLEWATQAECGPGARVDFANFYLTLSKTALIDQLLRFREAGAQVVVAANDTTWSKSQRKRLVKAGAEVYDTDLSKSVYMHRKMLDATGCVGGPFGAQGSTTMNATAYLRNGNQILTTRDPIDVEQMRAGMTSMLVGKRLILPADV